MYFKKYLQQDYTKLSENDSIRLLIEHLTYSSSQEKNYNAYQREQYLDTNNRFFSYLFTHVFCHKKHQYKLRKILNYISSRASVASFNNFQLEKIKFLQFLYHLIHHKASFQTDLFYQTRRYTMSSYYLIFEIVKKLHYNIDDGKVIYKYPELDWYLHLLKYSSKLHLPIKDYFYQINGNDYFSDFPIYIYNLYTSNSIPQKNKDNKKRITHSIIDYLFKHHKTLQCNLYSENHNLMFELMLTRDTESFNLGIKLLKQFKEEDYFFKIDDGVENMSNLDVILSYAKPNYISYLIYEKAFLFEQDKLQTYCEINPIASLLYNSSLSLEEKKEFIAKMPHNLTHEKDKERGFLFYYVENILKYGKEFGAKEKAFFNWLKNKFNLDVNEQSQSDKLNLIMFSLKKSQFNDKFSYVKKDLLEFLIMEQKVSLNLSSHSFHPLHFLVKVPFQEDYPSIDNGLAFDFFKNILDYFKVIGVDPNVSTQSGNNALHFAFVSHVHHKLVALLLDFGVNVNQNNLYKKSAHDYYKDYEHKKREMLLPHELVEFEQTHQKVNTYYEQNLLNQQFLIDDEKINKRTKI
jgi:hypothetical protein